MTSIENTTKIMALALTNMKETIQHVLSKYDGKQINMDSQSARDMIADELVDELNSKFVISKKNSDDYWENAEPGMDY
mgnify:CR=1 FL=1